MKTVRSITAVFVPVVVLLGAFAGQASAGGRYGWGSAGCCCGGYGCGSCGQGGCGEFGCGGYGYGGCGCNGAAYGTAFSYVGDYAPYIIGHGPMFPAGDSPSPVFWYGAPGASDTSTAPSRR